MDVSKKLVYPKMDGENNGKPYSLGIQSPCHRMIGVYNHLLRRVFRFHYHSQKVIGSLGIRVDDLGVPLFLETPIWAS